MKKYLTISAACALVLAACSTPQVNPDDSSSEVSQSSAGSSEDSTAWVAVKDKQFGLSFSHPSAWGTWALTQIPSQPNTDVISEMSFTELDRTIQHPEAGKADVDFILRKYDESKYRYEEVCDDEQSIDLCDAMKQQDLLEEKQQFITKARQTIGGVPATRIDFYDVPSGYVARKVQFYTPTHRVHFTAIYNIGDFLSANDSSDASLYDTAQKLLGAELTDPIYRLSKAYPEELQEMAKFYQDVDQLLHNIRISE